jgi:hypothetical protein
MAKKDYEFLEKLCDAVTRFKKIKAQDPGDNEIFSEELSSIIIRLHDREHVELNQKFEKAVKASKLKQHI